MCCAWIFIWIACDWCWSLGMRQHIRSARLRLEADAHATRCQLLNGILRLSVRLLNETKWLKLISSFKWIFLMLNFLFEFKLNIFLSFSMPFLGIILIYVQTYVLYICIYIFILIFCFLNKTSGSLLFIWLSARNSFGFESDSTLLKNTGFSIKIYILVFKEKFAFFEINEPILISM